MKGTKPVPPKKGTGTFIRPVNVGIYSSYGYRWGRLHAGIDLAAPTGTTIKAADGGTVSFAGSVSYTHLDVYKRQGFPGVPLAILSPEKEFVLVDSLNKRLKIIQELCENIGINNVKTIHGRAEDLAQNPAHRQMYDICVSRAVANLNVLFEYCLPFVNTGGYMFAYKGAGAENEINLAKNVMKKLGAGEYLSLIHIFKRGYK